MAIMRRILMISVLVGLLAGANSAIADLGLALTPVVGAPTGYRTFDIEATTTTELGVMEMVFDAADPASIYQVGSPSPPEASGGTYDTYLTMPVNWEVFGSAVDINSDPESWDDQNLNKAWNPQNTEHSGPGTFQVGRVTLANWASASYAIMGWEGGQTGPGTTLTGSFEPTPIGLSAVLNTDGPGGHSRYYDFYADVATNLGAVELLFNTSGLGGIHQTSLIADDPDNGDAYDSYVSTGYPSSGEQPGNTELLGAAVDIPGTSGVQAFDTQNIDLTWASSGGTQTGPGQFHVGRVAVADAASGSWTLKGFQGDADDPVTISGNFAEFPFGISVVEGSGTGVAGYNRYLDFFADVTTNLGAMELLLNTDSAGDVYQVSTTANDPNNGDAFDSYVSTGYPSDSEQPGNTVLLGAAVDIAGTSGVQTFTNQDVDLTWAPSGGTQTAGGRFHIGRMTLADSATGSWILKGFQSDLGGVIESIEISGTIEAAGIVHNPGDVTGEGFVGADDLVAILTNWGVSGAGVTWETGDIAPYNDGTNTGDDFIGADDYVAVLTNWGTTYPPEPGEAVPEPATIAMLALAGAALILRRCQVN